MPTQLKLLLLILAISQQLIADITPEEYAWEQICHNSQNYPNTSALFDCRETYIQNASYAFLEISSWITAISGFFATIGIGAAAYEGLNTHYPVPLVLSGIATFIAGIIGPSIFINSHPNGPQQPPIEYRLKKDADTSNPSHPKRVISITHYDTDEKTYNKKSFKGGIVFAAILQIAAASLSGVKFMADICKEKDLSPSWTYTSLYGLQTLGGVYVLIDSAID